jgi:hypothetical protein
MRKAAIFLALALLLFISATPVLANGIPSLPHAFYGTVTVNGAPAADGTQVSATVDNGTVITNEQNPTTTVGGSYGIDSPRLLVQGDIANGATITFHVTNDNGTATAGTATFEAGGGPTEKNLSVDISEGELGGVGGGGGGNSGVTAVQVDSEHRFVESYHALSDDGLVSLDIAAGTRGETATGQGLTFISIKKMTSPPALPANTNVVALVYELKPDGAQFPDGATLTMHYDAAAIQGGILVIAYWDGAVWVDLEGPFEIDPVNQTISTTIYHFTPFTVIEYVAPAAFTASDLTISPEEVAIGEEASIVFTLTNTGDLSGTYEVVLKVNGVETATATAHLDGRESYEVTFTLSRDAAGTYTISIDGLSGTLTVTALPTPTPTPTPTLTPTPTPTPTPTLTPTPTPTPTPTLTPTPTPTPTLGAPEEGLHWWVFVIIGAGVVIISVVILMIMYRRRA